jgi:hypothetical protein
MAKRPELIDHDSPIGSDEPFTLLSPALANFDVDYAGFFEVPPDNLQFIPPQEKPGKRGAK